MFCQVLNSWFVMEDRDNNVREDDDPAVCPESEIMVRVLTVYSSAKSIFSRTQFI